MPSDPEYDAMASFGDQLELARRAALSLDAHFSPVFGARWHALRDALVQPVTHVARLNKFACEERSRAQLPASARAVEDLRPSAAFEVSGDEQFAPPQPVVGEQELLGFYLMDGASVFPALALDVRPGECVLDMCAAPGGKTLVLAEALFAAGEGGHLVANDCSATRRRRLSRCMAEYLPPQHLARVTISGRDALDPRWAREAAASFDRILLDAPCSSDRHVLGDVHELACWSSRRIKENARRQEGLLLSALEMVRVGGRVVYSTCALSAAENDGVVGRCLKRRPGRAKVVRPERVARGELTEHGIHILPDRGGWGPIYYAVLDRAA